MKATIYNSNGLILRTLDIPEDIIPLQYQEGSEFLLLSDSNQRLDYVLDNTIIPRPTQLTSLDKTTITANGVDVISITNAPDGTFTAVNTATNDTITGIINGSDTFSTTIVGTYKITIVAWPYLDFETTITAV